MNPATTSRVKPAQRIRARTRILLVAKRIGEPSGLRIRAPIGHFQAVQAHLVTIHQQAAVVASALEDAVELGRGGFEIGCATILADLAAQLVTAAAHQTHGAIGMTKECPLHYLTRRIWAWRDEGRGHHRWADRLGAALGPDGLYPAIQCGSEVVP